MSTLVKTLAQEPLVETIGWVLLHFLWQGAVVALVAAVVLRLLARQRAEWRYAVACAALVVMFVFPLVTFSLLAKTAAAPAPASGDPISSPLLAAPDLIAGAERWQLRAEAALPAVVILWAVGVVILSLRLLSGLLAIEMLARRTTELPAAVKASAAHLADRLGIAVVVRFARSASIEVPTVIGWLRPVVLVPASAITGLTPAQLETLLAHELAHIRRYDYFVNLLQTVVEIALFYHPGVWWISKQIRAEREHCCDDIVVDLCADPLLYARALTDLEALRALPASVAVAASGGSLRDRVLRLLAVPDSRCSQRGRASMVILLMTSLMLLVPMMLLAREIARHAPTVQSLSSMSPGRAAEIVIDVFADALTEPRSVGPQTPPKLAAAASLELEIDDLQIHLDEAGILLATEPPAPAGGGRGATPLDERIDRAVEKKIFGVTDEFRDSMARLGYDLTDEKLIEFRVLGVTPRYIEQINAAGLGRLSADRILEFRVHRVTPEYIATMNAVGLGTLSARQIVEFRVHGVAPEFIQQMRAAGLGELSAQQLVELRIHRVTPAYIASMSSALGRDLSLREILELAVHRTSPESIDAARRMFPDASMQQIVALHIHRVTPDFVTDMRTRGYELRTAEKAAELRIHRVTPQFVDALRAAGYANVPLDDLVRMKIHRVDAAYIARLREEGLHDLTIDQMIRLRASGLDPAELRRR
jgi:beta-lactamase regulating signal transducer with metallopeptidase domain